jgi:hypothetical protein
LLKTKEKMKVKVTKEELKECIVNAMKRVMNEGKTFGSDRYMNDFDDEDGNSKGKDKKNKKKDSEKNFQGKKAPKHGKLNTQTKEKYKKSVYDWGENDDE